MTHEIGRKISLRDGDVEKRLVASLSRRIFSQSFENGTDTVRRRSFRM